MAEQEKDLIRKSIGAFDGGLNLFDRKDNIKDNQLTGMSNMVFDDGKLLVDTGFNAYALTGGSSVTGIVRKLYMHWLKSGAYVRFIFTKTAIWCQLSTADTTWVAVTDSGGSSAYSCTGSASLPITAVTWMAEDTVLWTNGVDVVSKIYFDSVWECAAIGGLDNVAASDSDPKVIRCQDIAIWQDRLMLINTTEGTVTRKPQIVRWSDEADFEEWQTSIVDASSDAGYQYLYEDGGENKYMELLENYLIIYRERAIVRASWIGSSDQTIKFQTMIPTDGLLGSRCVAAASDAHYICTRRGVFRYTAGVSMQPIGGPINEAITGPNALIDLTKGDYMYAQYMFVEKTCWFIFQHSNNTDTIAFVYDTQRNTWYRRDIVDTLLTSLSLSWVAPLKYFTMATTTDGANGKILIYDHTTLTDDRTGSADNAIPWSFETKNFASDKMVRSDHVEVDAIGGSSIVVTIKYSTNDGITWTSFGTFTFPSGNATTELIQYKVFTQIVARNVMFQVSGTGGGCKFGHFTFAFMDESDY